MGENVVINLENRSTRIRALASTTVQEAGSRYFRVSGTARAVHLNGYDAFCGHQTGHGI